MARRTAFGWSFCQMHYSRISLNFNPTVPRKKSSESLSPAAPFFIINTYFSSKVRISDESLSAMTAFLKSDEFLELHKTIKRAPQIHSSRVSTNLKPKLRIPDSRQLNLDGKHESRSALTAFLKSYEFSEPEIHRIIKSHPKILSSRVSTNLKPKLDYLVECGFHGSALRRVITSDPQILSRSLHNHIKPRYQFLKAYLMEKVNLAIMRISMILRQVDVELSVEYLKKEGVPVECITKLLVADPYSLAYGKSRLTKLVEETKASGIQPTDKMFVWYIRMFGSMSKTSWKKKLEVFKSLGWSDQDIRATLLRYPLCFQASEEKLRENMDFYINTVKIEPKAIISYPNLLMLSLNGRIAPRYKVMKLLKEHNLLKSWKASQIFKQPDNRFISKYIEKNLEQVPHLLQVYCDSKKPKSDSARLHS